MRVSGGTGQIASMPVQRLANDAARERRRGLVRLARPDRHRRQAQAAAVDDTPCACSRARASRRPPSARRTRTAASVAGRRARTSGSAPPNTATELVNTNLGGATLPPARLEPRARRVDVDAPAEIEILLRLAADHGREMEHAVHRLTRTRARSDASSARSPATNRDPRVVDGPGRPRRRRGRSRGCRERRRCIGERSARREALARACGRGTRRRR